MNERRYNTSHGEPYIAELAAQYATGALPPDEHAAFESRLISGDMAAIDALSELAPAIDALNAGIPEVDAGEALRARVLAGAKVPEKVEPPILTLRADVSDWFEMGPKVRARVLLADKTIKRQTLLIKMEPGADYPDHHHDGLEECYVVEGDLHIAGVTLRTGDYQRCLGGTDHGPSYSVGGCTLLITVPMPEAA